MISYPFNIDPVNVIETSSEDKMTSDTEGDRHHKRVAVLKSEIKEKPKDDFYMPNNRMLITQKLLLGFDINTPLKYCPLCDYVSMEKLKRHMTRMHSNSMQAPVGENIDKLLSLESKSCKLVRLSMVRELMGGKLWRDLNVRKALHRLFQMLQIKLWQGNWLIPGVPTVDHLSPYVKKEYLDDFYEQMEAEIYDDVRYDEKTIHPPILTTETTATTSVATTITTTTIKDTKVTERQTLDDSVDDILENLPLTESKHVYDFMIYKKNKRCLNTASAAVNVDKCRLLAFDVANTLAARLFNAGLQNQLATDHPLLCLYRNVLNSTHPTQPETIDNYLATASRVLRYVQDKCNRENVPVHHWVVLLQKPDYIIEYLER
ncbi:Uncharacterized protein FWK35_00028422 [Aphis craccivora]|uniref:Uncharacterized protein n=1 Tax=Aphis craccivora TaxID=307492 RepID=A0A6G0XSX2_APHCR|nr:Uncharacterized protein FWK35_00028422 [Aphis craccivora]